VDETFDDFDRDPISGASLGQVYTARYQGNDVAVKVRRPGIESLVEADLRTIRWSIPLVKRFTGSGQAFSLENLADEFAKTIREEMDYKREREMLEEIRANFADDDRIRIPTAYEAVSGPRVLTMEYIPGTKINQIDELDARGFDRNDIAETLQEVYLQMIIDDGVFHADPHPGNLAVADDGTVIFYDFGMAGRVDPFIQEKIVEFYVAVARQDIDGILDTLIDMGTLSPEADREVMGSVMELAIADASGEDIEQYQVNQIIEQVESTIYEFPLRLPPNLALVLRVATVVEGVCVTLDPEFDFISTATEYLRDEGYYEQTARDLAEDAGRQVQRTTEALFTVPPKADDFLERANRGDLHVDVTIDDESNVLDKLAMRIAYSVLLAVGVLSSTILYSFADAWRLAGIVLLLAVPLAVALYRSFRKKQGIRARPQFTRQGMKQRRDD
ncbi:MAG: AarF/UbiB family protein, partial [Halorubrum sp.]|uniref:ABC1 kinase family protein n=1 Tax=Halorubrum sp. TaxID=1879286 RepID=UPI0039708603